MLDIVAAAQDANIGKFGVGQKHTNSLLDEKADEDDIDDAFQLAEISPISELFDDFSFTGAAKKHQQQQCPSNSSQYCILIKCKAIGQWIDKEGKNASYVNPTSLLFKFSPISNKQYFWHAKWQYTICSEKNSNLKWKQIIFSKHKITTRIYRLNNCRLQG